MLDKLLYASYAIGKPIIKHRDKVPFNDDF